MLNRLVIDLDRQVILAICAGWLVALCVFKFFFVINDSGIRVQFASGPAFLDFGLYSAFQFENFSALGQPLEFSRIFWAEGAAAAFDWLAGTLIAPGPVYPALIHLFSFQVNPVFLSGIYIVLGVLLGGAWATWAKRRDLSQLAQVALGTLPFLVYYSVLVSTDLIFAVLVWIFFRLLSQTNSIDKAPFFSIIAVIVLAILTRPTGLIFVGIAGLILALQAPEQMFKRSLGYVFMFFLLVISMWGAVYYAPYYLIHDANGTNTPYFGRLPGAYRMGLYPELPDTLNQVVSYVLLFGAKLLHAVGLRPSYADIDLPLTLARSLPGLIFLPGLLMVMCKGSHLERVFVGLFMLPIFIAASQERYLLGVMPILFFWGWVFWAGVFSRTSLFLRRQIF